MSMTLISTFASSCYIIATLMQLKSVTSDKVYHSRAKLLGGLAAVLHGYAAIYGLLSGTGIDLGIYPMLSLITLSIVAIVLFTSMRRPIENLFVVIFPVAAVALLLELSLQNESTIREEIPTGMIGHIILSIIAYSILTIAAIQAALLSLGDNLLRNRRLAFLRRMPSLETMEQLMFEMVAWGLGFLTLSIASGFFSLRDISSPGLWHHTIITLMAWTVFLVLLWGRYSRGWRGEIASRWALIGFVLLALGYFGSKVVLEIVLQQ